MDGRRRCEGGAIEWTGLSLILALVFLPVLAATIRFRRIIATVGKKRQGTWSSCRTHVGNMAVERERERAVIAFPMWNVTVLGSPPLLFSLSTEWLFRLEIANDGIHRDSIPDQLKVRIRVLVHSFINGWRKH